MPTLADIYSFIDTQKRKAGNLLRSPVSTLQEMAALSNDEARQINQQTALASQGRRQEFAGQPQTPEQIAARQELQQKLLDSMNIGGMTVWHGSPYSFTKFDPAKIGTGEGRQNYGHGLYVAENPEVASAFKNGLTNRNVNLWKDVEDALPDFLKGKAADWSDAILGGKTFSDLAAEIKEPWKRAALQQKKQDLEDIIKKQQSSGNLYKIDLPDKHIARMLDYEEEIKNQPKAVRDLAKKLGLAMDDIGIDLLNKVGRDKAGSEALQAAGIPGIKYYDQMAPKDGKSTRNFVVFDPNHLQILEHKQ